MIEKYYEEELRYLYDSGCEFAKAHPDRAHYLNIDSVGDRDPYVERLFEGFAFLTARIREKLDDSFPQLTQGLTNLMWPQFLQEIPALAIAQFEPRPGILQESKILPERSEIVSGPVGAEGVICRFTTTQPVILNPMTLASVNRVIDKQNNETISFTFALEPTVLWNKYNFSQIRFYLHAELPTALLIHRMLTTSVIRAEVQLDGNGPLFHLDPATAITPGSMGVNETLLPSMRRGFWGYNLLREYFVYPEKFLCVDLNGMGTITPSSDKTQTLTYRVTLAEPFPADRQITANMFRLHCCPVANIFVTNTEPVTKSGLQSEYRVIANSSYSKSTHVHSVRSVVGIDRITGERFSYEPLHTFKNIGNKKQKTFTTQVVRTPGGARETNLILSGSQMDVGDMREESLVIEGWCTNGAVPRDSIREGEIKNPGRDFPDYVRINNITRPTLPCAPPDDEDLLWIFQAHLAATQTSLASKEVLQKFLSLYNWSGQEGRARRIEAIDEVTSEPMETIYKGSVIRGVRFIVNIVEQAFKDVGDLHLFGMILSRFLSQYVPINSFCELRFVLKPSGKSLVWNQIEGTRCLM